MTVLYVSLALRVKSLVLRDNSSLAFKNEKQAGLLCCEAHKLAFQRVVTGTSSTEVTQQAAPELPPPAKRHCKLFGHYNVRVVSSASGKSFCIVDKS